MSFHCHPALSQHYCDTLIAHKCCMDVVRVDDWVVQISEIYYMLLYICVIIMSAKENTESDPKQTF